MCCRSLIVIFDTVVPIPIAESVNDVGFTTTYRDDPFFIDPRNKKLGARVIINLEKIF